ncbi:MAG: triose-phosphate isomerase [Gammaproteobacteria bacterium]|nr:triose-phosphate isomerase [Gammaproteobacteria bacterium]
MRTPIVAGNWKLNGTRASARSLAQSIVDGLSQLHDALRVIVCPTFVHLGEVAEVTAGTPLALGAQDAADQQSGAFTGEVAAPMLAEYGCRYVIIGHSERRHVYGESDTLTAAKYAAVQAAGLTPIYCVGETLEERESGTTQSVVARQLRAVRDLLGDTCFADAVIAYEPVWAIGTGRTASPEQAQDVHSFIRGEVPDAQSLSILYGGSVKPGNAGELFAMPDIDGGLIGGAALDAADFLAICAATRMEQ